MEVRKKNSGEKVGHCFLVRVTRKIFTYNTFFLTPSSTVSVECSARVVGKVETKNRLGKIDGRYPHWVSPYDGERWSLVFYRTEEGNGQEVGPAIFNVDE